MTAETMTDAPAPGRSKPSRGGRIAGAVSVASISALQVICGVFFVYDLAASIFGWRDAPISWTLREAIEIMATVGLLLGMVLGGVLIRTLLMQRQRARERLRAAAGEFHQVVMERFDEWGLTPSERDVAFFMLKGFSNAEIAALRATSEGTIKAQSTSIFRKAGVSGRAQLLSGFIEEVLAVEPEN